MYTVTKSDYKHNSNKMFCHTCFSTDRQLFPLIKYIDIFKKLCNTSSKNSSNTMICWECTALLEKVKQFQRKVKKAQEIMRFQNLNSQDSRPLQSTLSNLTKVNINQERIINCTHEEKEIKVTLRGVKQEINDDSYDLNNLSGVDTDHVCSDDMKQENPSKPFEDTKNIKIETCDTINKKRSRRKQYKFVTKRISTDDINRLSVIIPLTTDQICLWMEKDRHSQQYRNLTFKCESCVYGWSDEQKFAKHNRKYHDSSLGPFSCDICSSRFNSLKTVSRHIRVECQVRQCVACSWRGRAREMARHLAVHSRLAQCLTCLHTFSNVRVFYKHFKALHEFYICDHCGKKCKSKRILINHMRRHFENFECKTCNKTYKSRGSYSRHYDTKHAITTDENTYCVQCDKQFINVLTYKRHIASSTAHASERDGARTAKKVSCPECGRLYSRKTYMMNHYRHVHMNQSKYYCRPCDKHFLNRTRYVEHTRYNHEGVKKEKNKLCNICGRGFAANRTLINHIRTHSGERPYECEYCGAKFTQKHAMTSHVQYIHLKSKRKHCWQ